MLPVLPHSLIFLIFFFCNFTKNLKNCDFVRTRFCDAIPAAISDGDFLYLKFCVENGANINAKDLSYGFSFLHWAIIYGKLEIAKFLL